MVEDSIPENAIYLKQEPGKKFMKYALRSEFAEDPSRPFTFRNMRVKSEGRETFLKGDGFYPSVDIVDCHDGTKIIMELPGVQKQNLKMTIQKHIINIQATKTRPYDLTDKIRKVECTFGSFLWKYEHTAPIQAKQIKKSFEDGLLTIVLPKGEEEEVEICF